MNENFKGNPAIMQLLEELRRRGRMQNTGQMQHQGIFGGMGNRFGGLGGMGRMGGRPEEFGPGMRFGGGKPDMNNGRWGPAERFGGGKPGERGGWGTGFKPSFGGSEDEMVQLPEDSPVTGNWDDNGGWGPATSWDGPRQSMGQRDAPMPMQGMPTRDAPMPMQGMPAPQMGQRAPQLMSLLQAMKRPKGRGNW